MLQKIIFILLVLAGVSIAQNAPVTPTTPPVGPGGSKIVADIKALLPNFAEWEIVVQGTNVYIQVSSLLRTFNKAVAAFEDAQKQLESAKASAESLWGDVNALKDANIYSLDGWHAALDHTQNKIIGNDMQGFVYSVSKAGMDFTDGFIGSFESISNDLSYNARAVGVSNAFYAYYRNLKWSEFLASSQNIVDGKYQSLIDGKAKISEIIVQLANWSCPENMDPTSCKGTLNQYDQMIISLKSQSDKLDSVMQDQVGFVTEENLKGTQWYLKQKFIDKSIRKIHMDIPDFIREYEEMGTTGAKIAQRLASYQDNRVSSQQKQDTSPNLPNKMKAANYTELCNDEHPDNFKVDPITGARTCIYGDPSNAAYKNSAELPQGRTDTADFFSLASLPHEKPRPLTLNDYQKLKAQLSYIQLRQEQLLLDIEIDMAYLDFSRKISKIESMAQLFRTKVEETRMYFGQALNIQRINDQGSENAINSYYEYYHPNSAWDLNKDVPDLLAQ